MDVEIRLLEQQILQDINASVVPIEAKRLVLLSLLLKIEKEADVKIHEDIQKLKKE